jgi:hypothetical protein
MAYPQNSVATEGRPMHNFRLGRDPLTRRHRRFMLNDVKQKKFFRREED